MHKAEHGRIRPNCERDGGNRHSREPRAVAKQANGVTKVVNHAVSAYMGFLSRRPALPV